MANPGATGVYHYAGHPDVSWADFARAIFEVSGLSCTVEDIPTSDYPTPAARPLNSRIDCQSFETVFGLQRPDWRANLAVYLSKYESP
jgi:dTDP-4-dehydrorhamnose reductase